MSHHDRLFLALWLSPDARADLGARIAPMRTSAGADITWQPTSHWHITIAFLGQQARNERERICRAAAAAARTADATEVRIASSGQFNTALWAGLSDAAWLERLAVGLTRRLGLGSNDHEFHAHVTVARSESAVRAHEFRAQLSDYQGPRWLPQRLSLVDSSPHRTPRYRLLQSWQLNRGR